MLNTAANDFYFYMLTTQLIIWAKFLLCAVFIGLAGTKLTHYADVIADKTSLSGSWIGLILLATVTSLPELITGVSALILADVPDIAVGSVMGSCVFNLVILVILDFMLRGQSIYRSAGLNHVLSAGFGMILIAFAGLSIIVSNMSSILDFNVVGVYTPIIVVCYLVAMRVLFIHEQEQVAQSVQEVTSRYPEITLTRAFAGYLLSALVVVIVGIYLPFVGTELADIMGWNKTFVGTLFIALTTSLPELAVTIAALRMGALDMAFANVLGSNLFNVAILALNDLVFLRGALLSYITSAHAISAFTAVVMTGLVIVGLVNRPKSNIFLNLNWISLSLLAAYLFNTYVLYVYNGS